MQSNLDAAFLPVVCQLVTSSDNPERLFLKKVAACWTARGVCERYLQEGIREELVRTILDKKLALIAGAKTSAEIDQIFSQPRPRYDYGVWVESPYCIPEEELACWAIVSANNVLIPEAKERYMKLFAEVMGGEATTFFEQIETGSGNSGGNDSV